jgi:hypothetical protein
MTFLHTQNNIYNITKDGIQYKFKTNQSKKKYSTQGTKKNYKYI